VDKGAPSLRTIGATPSPEAQGSPGPSNDMEFSGERSESAATTG
jgi:hypothetical protein